MIRKLTKQKACELTGDDITTITEGAIEKNGKRTAGWWCHNRRTSTYFIGKSGKVHISHRFEIPE